MSYDVWSDGPQHEPDDYDDCSRYNEMTGRMRRDCPSAGTEFCDFDCPFGLAAQKLRASRLAEGAHHG